MEGGYADSGFDPDSRIKSRNLQHPNKKRRVSFGHQSVVTDDDAADMSNDSFNSGDGGGGGDDDANIASPSTLHSSETLGEFGGGVFHSFNTNTEMDEYAQELQREMAGNSGTRDMPWMQYAESEASATTAPPGHEDDNEFVNEMWGSADADQLGQDVDVLDTFSIPNIGPIVSNILTQNPMSAISVNSLLHEGISDDMEAERQWADMVVMGAKYNSSSEQRLAEQRQSYARDMQDVREAEAAAGGQTQPTGLDHLLNRAAALPKTVDPAELPTYMHKDKLHLAVRSLGNFKIGGTVVKGQTNIDAVHNVDEAVFVPVRAPDLNTAVNTAAIDNAGVLKVECAGCMSDIPVHGHIMTDISNFVCRSITSMDLRMIVRTVHNIYREKVVKPQLEAGVRVVLMTENMWYIHFTKHDDHPLMQKKCDLSKFKKISDMLCDNIFHLDADSKTFTNLRILEGFIKVTREITKIHTSKITASPFYPKTRAEGMQDAQFLSMLRPLIESSQSKRTNNLNTKYSERKQVAETLQKELR